METENLTTEDYELELEKQEVFEVKDVPIFKVGKWNGDEYTKKDLQDIVKSFKEIGGKLKPYLKLGHDKNQKLLQKDGYPAAGWITDLKVKGEDLLATFTNIPRKVAQLIQNKAMGRVSSEIFWNLKMDGKVHRRALKAVSLLGSDTPAVESLDDFINLYTEEDYEDIKIHEIKEEANMADNHEIEVKVDLDTEVLKNYELKIAELEKEVDTQEEKIKALQSEIQEKEYSKIESEVDNYLEGAIKDGKITPAKKDSFKSIALDSDNKTYGKFEEVKAIIEASPETELKEEVSEYSHIDKEEVHANTDEQKSEILDKKIKEYMKSNNMDDSYENYRDALIEVTKED